MSPQRSRTVVAAVLLFGLSTGSTAAQNAEECKLQKADPTCTPYLADRVEIKLTAPLNPDQATSLASLPRPGLRALLQPLGATLEPSVSPSLASKYDLTRIYTVRLPATATIRLEALLKDLQSLTSEVARAARVPRPRSPGFDPFVGDRDKVDFPDGCPCGTQWYLYRTGVTEAWKQGITGKNVVVVVADWGFMTDHPELPVDSPSKPGALEMAHAFNACAPGEPVFPGSDVFHGVATTGLVGARQDGKGMQGVAYEARIWPTLASCSGSSGNPCEASWGPANPWAQAIVRAIDEPSQERRKVLLLEVQSCCGGNYEASLAVENAIAKAIERGVVVVLAAGNGSRDAGCDEAGGVIEGTDAIIVGATTYKENALDSRSNYGKRIDVSAPGDALNDLTLAPRESKCSNKLYRQEFGGTSGAAAKVAGVAALMLQACPKLSPQDVKKILVGAGAPVSRIDGATADDPGTKRKGGSFLNADKAVKAALAACH